MSSLSGARSNNLANLPQHIRTENNDGKCEERYSGVRQSVTRVLVAHEP
jgi:hypothetical protein